MTQTRLLEKCPEVMVVLNRSLFTLLLAANLVSCQAPLPKRSPTPSPATSSTTSPDSVEPTSTPSHQSTPPPVEAASPTPSPPAANAPSKPEVMETPPPSRDFATAELGHLVTEAVTPRKLTPPPRRKRSLARGITRQFTPRPFRRRQPSYRPGVRNLTSAQAKLRDSFSRRREQAMIRFAEGRKAEARALLEEICREAEVANYDDASVVAAACGLASMSQAEDEARKWLKRGLAATLQMGATDWQREGVYAGLAFICEQQNEWAHCQTIITQVLLEEMRNETGLRVRLAVLDQKQGRLKEAESKLKTLWENDGWKKLDSRVALGLLEQYGRMLTVQQRYQEAVTVLECAFKLNDKAYKNRPFIVQRWVKHQDLPVRSREKILAILNLLEQNYATLGNDAGQRKILDTISLLQASPLNARKARHSRESTAFEVALGRGSSSWAKDSLKPTEFYNPRDHFRAPDLSRPPLEIAGFRLGMTREQAPPTNEVGSHKKSRTRVRFENSKIVMITGYRLSADGTVKVRKGDTRNQVLSSLGEPNYRGRNTEHWEYRDRNGFYRVSFSRGKVRRVAASPHSYEVGYLYKEAERSNVR